MGEVEAEPIEPHELEMRGQGRRKFAADKSEQVVDVLLSPSACQGTADTLTPRSFDISEDSTVSTASSVSDRKCESDRWPCESDPWTSQTPILTTTCSATTGTCNLSGCQVGILRAESSITQTCPLTTSRL